MRTIGRVKWFDAATGIGCVVSDGGALAVVDRAALARFGVETLPAGATLTYEIKLEGAWLTVTEIYEIGEWIAPGPDEVDADPWEVAHCKWFSRPKGFGFVETAAGACDVFVHMDVLRRCGLRELRPGQTVLVRARHSERGATAIEVAVDALRRRKS